ncbi:hypothetical protein [Spiroplasma endosymbiont of Labia minor]|uniref:hypothetical protein n=1 Tax=Spiroplasma endosymbiont of Labia minor TaxID=3066305 RepID=UPI0030D33EE1
MDVQNFLNKLSFQTYFDWHKKLLTENVTSFVKNDNLNLSNELEEYRLLDSFKVNINKLEELLKNSFLYDVSKFLKRTHTKSTGTIAFKKYCKFEEFGLHISEPIYIFSSFRKYLSPFFTEIKKDDNSIVFEQNTQNFDLQKITTYAQATVIKKIKEINCSISYIYASKKN